MSGGRCQCWRIDSASANSLLIRLAANTMSPPPWPTGREARCRTATAISENKDRNHNHPAQNPIPRSCWPAAMMEMRRGDIAGDIGDGIQNTDKIAAEGYAAWRTGAWETIMIKLTRRTLLVGHDRADGRGHGAVPRLRRRAHLSRAARGLHGLSEPAAEELADRAEERRRAGPRLSAEQRPGAGQVRAGKRHAARRRRRRRQRLADPCGDHGRARRPRRQGAARRLRLSASVRPWRAAAAGQDRQRDRRARRDLPAQRHRQVGQSRQGRAQRADGRRDRRRARRDPRQGRLRLGGVRLLPFGHGDARRRGRRERAQGRGQPISAFRKAEMAAGAGRPRAASTRTASACPPST